MALVGNVTTPIQFVSLPVANVQEGTEFLFNPILLRALLYIAFDGELRVTNPCLSEELINREITMIKICNKTTAGNGRCFHASKDGSHFLATDEVSGRLIPIRSSTAPDVLYSTSSYCLAFEEVTYTARGQLTIIGCPSSAKHRLSFSRLRFPHDSSCDTSRYQVFSQSVSSSTSTRPRNMVISPSETYSQAVLCQHCSG